MKGKEKKYSVSVIIPCYNEEGNIEKCILRVPKLGNKTEIIVVDDGSKDQTVSIVKRLIKKNPSLKLITYKQNHGKGYAVNTGMKKATGDILVILDADMTVPPEDLPKFINPLISEKAQFTNGTRFKKTMEKGAMKRMNLIGNKLMGKLFTMTIKQEITDSLCGTKALFKNDFKKMGGIDPTDPWSDFSLIFGAAKLNLKIKEIPVAYKKRVAGKSKMKLIQHGSKMLSVWWNQYNSFKKNNLNG